MSDPGGTPENQQSTAASPPANGHDALAEAAAKKRYDTNVKWLFSTLIVGVLVGVFVAWIAAGPWGWIPSFVLVVVVVLTVPRNGWLRWDDRGRYWWAAALAVLSLAAYLAVAIIGSVRGWSLPFLLTQTFLLWLAAVLLSWQTLRRNLDLDDAAFGAGALLAGAGFLLFGVVRLVDGDTLLGAGALLGGAGVLLGGVSLFREGIGLGGAGVLLGGAGVLLVGVVGLVDGDTLVGAGFLLVGAGGLLYGVSLFREGIGLGGAGLLLGGARALLVGVVGLVDGDTLVGAGFLLVGVSLFREGIGLAGAGDTLLGAGLLLVGVVGLVDGDTLAGAGALLVGAGGLLYGVWLLWPSGRNPLRRVTALFRLARPASDSTPAPEQVPPQD